MRSTHLAAYSAAILGLAMLLTGCQLGGDSELSEKGEGDTAVWEITNPTDLDRDSTTVSVAVTRVGCSSGITGNLLDPSIDYESDRVVIRIDVEPLEGEADCPGNDAIALDVQLDEPLGQRTLVDGGCLREDAAATILCTNSTRWPA